MLKIFDELETKREKTSLGIPRAEGEALYTFIKEHNIKTVIETGVMWGFTSHYILAALQSGGRLISIEPCMEGWIGGVVAAEYRDKWEIIHGTSRNRLLEVLKMNPDTDLFFHDSDHSLENQAFEYETAFPYVKFVGSHDISFNSPVPAWVDFKRRHSLTAKLELGELGICQTK